MFDPIPTPTNMTWTAGQVAVAVGMSEGLFKAKLPIWEQQHGFPKRLPGTNKWPKWAVLDWINSSAGTYAGHQRTIPDGDAEIDAVVSELERQYVTDKPLAKVA